MAIICTKNNPSCKKDKKQSYPPIYQWVSNNLYLEWNVGHHVQYVEHEFAWM